MEGSSGGDDSGSIVEDARLVERPHTASYLARMAQCAAATGRSLGPIKDQHLVTRLLEHDAALIEQGLTSSLLQIDSNYLRTRDPRRATAWLTEGDPAHPCWEHVPHAAAYVELIQVLRFPTGSVRFETPETEVRASLDLVVVEPSGQVVILGEVKMEAAQVARLADAVQEHATDPGKPAMVRSGGPQGLRREAWKLAHQLWKTQALWLWLVAAGRREAYRVRYDDGLRLELLNSLPGPDDVGVELAGDWPVLRLP